MSELASSSIPARPLPAAARKDADQQEQIAAAMATLVHPGSGHIGCVEAMECCLGLENATLSELASLPGGAPCMRLLSLRYLIANGPTWLRYFSWQKRLAKRGADLPERLLSLCSRLEKLREQLGDASYFEKLLSNQSLEQIAECAADPDSDASLSLLLALAAFDEVRVALWRRFSREGPALWHQGAQARKALDVVALLAQDLTKYPATTVSQGELQYVVVADKGEMGVRAVVEAADFGAVPVVVFSEQDDSGALQVRLAEQAGGFGVPLEGDFRQSYANPTQIAERVKAAYEREFGSDAKARLARSAVYPGYGPLAENPTAIAVFRRSGLAFVGPMQDVVESAGDKRKFRLLAQSMNPSAVTPGIVMDESDPEQIEAQIEAAARAGKFQFPGRLKAANGGGGRGQVVLDGPHQVPGAVAQVLREIQSNGWDPGVMFEQNIFETTHLEVQVLRDRFGNTRHFGMRDCTEQRASQKIQEEAPPAILRDCPELKQEMEQLAVRICDAVNYVGACTVELMYKDGKFYLLEMNTRIQVEHPVSEEAHRISSGDELLPVNLVALQLQIAAGMPLGFSQDEIVCTHVAREFRINAESFQPHLKDPRDGKKGLFLPNAGVFDEITVPDAAAIEQLLVARKVRGVEEVSVRFDCGFEVGDDLVNKDPTFGKLIVSVRVSDEQSELAFELLRQVSILVLEQTVIAGRQLLPNRKVLPDQPFRTNLSDHIALLKTEMLEQHSRGVAPGRHVNWVLAHLREVQTGEQV